MATVPSPHLSYGKPAFFHAANQQEAIRNAVFLNLGYLPIYFLVVCIYKNPNILQRYKTTIVFAGIVQYMLTLPYTIFNSWLALYVNHEVETTVFFCTFARMGTSALNFVSFNALTAISLSRLITIVLKWHCGLAWNVVFFWVASAPILGDVIYMFFVSRPTQNHICGPLLFFYELAPTLVWNVYIFSIPLIAVVLNCVTAGYLLYKRYTTEGLVQNSRRNVNELFIAAALLAQSVIPALTMSSKGYRSIQDIYGIKTVDWLKDLIETSGYMTTGLNMTASMICIKHFRQMFRKLLMRDKSITRIGDVTTVTVRTI
ncbi:hypothetical protein PFISCL1PPCAC_607 [Pristionchus fissidentatus]|uniref:G protein-coupled receptor n=1 Tax=Pristionchus fissidentatus TaxID=1538716 RepID=A0AAV5UST2_9BILA|nr:hypothetical protein PFISCL1PPCAC_607 [Pristionchus fissidentatus]